MQAQALIAVCTQTSYLRILSLTFLIQKWGLFLRGPEELSGVSVPHTTPGTKAGRNQRWRVLPPSQWTAIPSANESGRPPCGF